MYGTTYSGGSNIMGSIFKINTDGSGYNKLLDFSGLNGAQPEGSLTLSGNILYGMTCGGGSNSAGCIFKIHTDGSNYTKLLDFDGINGWSPMGSLTLLGNALYGMTSNGGSNGKGCIFKINIDGNGYHKLIDFSGFDGRMPFGSLTISGSTLFGMTVYGGASDMGCIFKYHLSLPVITNQPTSATICQSGNSSFSVTATNVTSYQWQVSTNGGTTWNNITSAGSNPVYSNWTTSTLSLSGVASSNNSYKYKVIVSNGDGSVTSDGVATLTVNTPPVITSQPGNQTVCSGTDQATFLVSATGTNRTYQWQQYNGSAWSALINGGIYSGVTTSTLTLTNPTTSVNGYKYRCVVSGTCTPSATTNGNATLTVNLHPVPVILGSAIVCTNSSGNVYSTTSGGSNYQWTVTGGTITAGGSPTNNSVTVTWGTPGTGHVIVNYTNTNGCTAVVPTNKSVTINGPLITTQPVSQGICSNNTGTVPLSVVTVPSTGPTFQWQKNGVNMSNDGYTSGVTTATLSMGNASSRAGNYICNVTYNGCLISSSIAVLSIVQIPSITSQPSSPAAVCAGNGTATFTVVASGAGLTYAWSQYNGLTWSTPLSNGGIYSQVTTASLKITNPTTSVNGYKYRCTVSGTCAPAVTTDGNATITVNPYPVITTQPLSKQVCSNDEGNVFLSIVATPSGSTYNWFKNGLDYAGDGYTNGMHTAILNMYDAHSRAGNYYCVVSINSCSVTSNTATITQIQIPAITVQPASPSPVCSGNDTANITVSATGAGLTYAWQQYNGSAWSILSNGGIYSGVTNATLTITNPTSAVNGYKYRCTVSGTCTPSVTSNGNATITVNPFPVITTQPLSKQVCSNDEGNVFLSIVATPQGSSYNWFKNGLDYAGDGYTSGMHTATLNMGDAHSRVGNYYCVVSINSCSVTSNIATITQIQIPAITVQPASPSPVCSGNDTANITVSATGAGLTYAWQQYNGSAWSPLSNGGIYSGVTTATLTLSNPTTSVNGYKYRCVISGTCAPSVTTNGNATLTINIAPVITVQPASPSPVCESNGSRSISVTATGTNLSYSWEEYNGTSWNLISNGPGYSGQGTNIITVINPPLAINGYKYRCTVSTSGCQSTISNGLATLSVMANPVITGQPASTVICNNTGNSVFTVSATGAGLTYLWQESNGGPYATITNGGIYSGQGASTLTLTNPPSNMEGYKYRCIVSGTCGTPVTTDGNATLSFNTTPAITSVSPDQTICEDQNLNLEVVATGLNLTYLWRFSSNDGRTWNDIQQSNSATYPIKAQNYMNGYKYYCSVSNVCGSVNSNNIKLTVKPLPVIGNQPIDIVICDGEQKNIEISSNGELDTYQWQQSNDGAINWTDISGKTSKILTIPGTASINGNYYRCKVFNDCGYITSKQAQLTVFSAPDITSQPVSLTACDADVVKFSLVANGNDLSYQWKKSTDNGTTWTTIAGANKDYFRLSVDNSMNGNRFKCTVTGSCDFSTISDIVVLTVNPRPVITVQPVDQEICEGQSVNYSVSASGSGLTYQWQEYQISWLNKVGETANTLSFIPDNTMNGRAYRCKVIGGCTRISDNASLTVNTSPQIITQPADLISCSGNTVAFSVGAAGSGLSYQWQLSTDNGANFNNITGEDKSSYVTTGNTSMNGYKYRSIVGGSCGSPVTSNVAQLSIAANPQITAQPTDQTVLSGNNATFSVGVTGTGISYQWQSKLSDTWDIMTGATGSSVDVLASETNAGIYRCIVNVICITNSARLFITPVPTIVTQPVNVVECEGKTALFHVGVEGNNLAYKWQFMADGSSTWNDLDASDENIEFTVSSADAGKYRCIITGEGGITIESNEATLTVNLNPAISVQPLTQLVCEGNPVTFSIDASGLDITYQWQKSADGYAWDNIDNAKDYQYIITNGDIAMNGNQYRCKIKGGCGYSVKSDPAVLTVNPNIQITSQPANQAVCNDETATFTIAATGQNPGYQWQEQISTTWSNITGATGTILNVIADPSRHRRLYHCVVSTTCGSTTSSDALLTIGPQVTKHPENDTACNGLSVTLGPVEAIGRGPMTYQWEYSTDDGITWTIKTGATESSFTFTATNEMNGYKYHCKVTGSCGNYDISEACKLFIFNTSITAHPVDLTLCEGQNGQFKISAIGTKLEYQWAESDDGIDWTDIPNTDFDTYKFTVSISRNYYNYMCKVKGACDATWTNSNSARLNVNPNSISTLSATVTPVTCEGGSDGAITVNTPTSNYMPLTYIWSNESSELNQTSLSTGKYTLKVTDNIGCNKSLTRDVETDAPITYNVSTTEIAIPGSSTGEVYPNVSGGHTPLTFLWNNGATTEVITGVPAGNYNLTVTDNRQCVKNIAATVIEETPVSITNIPDDELPSYKHGRRDDGLPGVDKTLAVGAISGSAGVSPTGAATYEIPVSMVPGVNGMQPNLSLVYNSQSGNGLLGWGWNIAGISAISRVADNVYSDNFAKGVNIDLTDKYALDGNRLVVKDGFIYGADASEYNTEIESYSTVRSHGYYGDTGPEWFEVEAKNGMKYKYGSNSGRLLYHHTTADGAPSVKNAIINWYLDYAEDQFGNFISYTYQQSGLFTYLTKITYGSKTNDNIGSIQLYYSADRTDPIPIHIGFLKNELALVLNKVVTYSEDKIYREYQLDYTSDNYERLVQVTESNSSGEKINPTIIEWGRYSTEIFKVNGTPLNFWTAYYTKENYIMSADVNNDGYSDLVRLFIEHDKYFWGDLFLANKDENGNVEFQKVRPDEKNYEFTSFVYNENYEINGVTLKQLPGSKNFGDINADGVKEIISAGYDNLWNGGTAGEVIFYSHDAITENHETRAWEVSKQMVHKEEVPLYSISDLNNDGWDEIIFLEKQHIDISGTDYCPGNIYYPKEDVWRSFNIPCQSKTIPFPPNFKIYFVPSELYVADFDGDGMRDIMVVDASGYRIFKNYGGEYDLLHFKSPFGKDINIPVNNSFSSNYKMQMGDFNGDGLPDFIIRKNNSSEWKFAINNGKMSFDFISLPNITASDDDRTVYDNDEDNIIVYDFNNDGKDDAIIFDARFHDASDWWEASYYRFTDLTVSWYESTGTGLKFIKQSYSTDEQDAFRKNYTIGDFNGDGRIELMNYGFNCYYGKDKERKWRIYSTPNIDNESNEVTSITNGLNLQTEFAYKPLSDKSSYARKLENTGSSSNPLYSTTPPIYIINESKTDNGVGGKDITEYSYEDAMIHKEGLGFLGFVNAKQTNKTTNIAIETNNTYNGIHPQTIDKQLIITSKDENLLSWSATYKSYKEIKDKHYYLDEEESKTSNLKNYTYINSRNYYSNLGNLTYNTGFIAFATPNVNFDYSKRYQPENFYDLVDLKLIQDISKTYLDPFDQFGNPESIETVYIRSENDKSYYAQNQSFTYFSNGKINTSTINGLTTTYTYNDYGNPFTVIQSATGYDDRGIIINYDVTGRFVSTKFSALNQKIEDNIYDGFGNLANQFDINLLETKFKYDSWDKLTQVLSPYNIAKVTALNWVPDGYTSAPENALYYVEDNEYFKGDMSNKQHVKTEYFDVLGRLLRTVTSISGDRKIAKDTKYNEKGQVIEAEGPYPVGETPSFTSLYTYNDELDLEKETLPDGIVKNYDYYSNHDGHDVKDIVKTTYSSGEVYIKKYDVTGQLIEADDPGGTITYEYSSTNKPTKIISNDQTTVEIKYDNNDWQESLLDPNAGTVSYGYNAFGEIESQDQPAVNSGSTTRRITETKYDKLGRIKTKTVNGIATTYIYDQGTKALGTLTSISRGDDDKINYEYYSDGTCNISKKTNLKNGESFDYQYVYEQDKKWRLHKLTYPAGLAVYYKYDDYDNVTGIYQNSDLSTSPVWELNALNAKGQLLTATYGNTKQITYGYDEYDRLINIDVPDILDFDYHYFMNKQQLEYRTEKYYVDGLWQGFKEDFTYDEVNRLKTCSISGIPTPPPMLSMDYTHAANDRMTSKSDAGSLYNYDNGNHQVSSITAVAGYLPPQHNITYTTEDKVATITETNDGVANKLLTFDYGVDNERFKSEYTEDGTRKFTRYYFDNYEKEILTDNTVRHLNYIYAFGSLVAIYEQIEGVEAMHYIFDDYFGSIRCVTDAAGNIEQKLSYDAWGNRRNPLTGVNFTTPPTNLLFARGFTGHEHMDELGLINMNGRVYDPMLAVFISPDNYIPAQDNTQNFNRYTYALNNPLMYTDPDGNFPWLAILIFAAWNANMQAMESLGQGGDYWNALGKGFVTGIITGVLSAGVAYMTPAGALPGAVYGGLTGATIGAISGGLNSSWVKEDGDFWEGAKNGALWGGSIGTVLGGIAGYQHAEHDRLNVWTGGDKYHCAPYKIHMHFPQINKTPIYGHKAVLVDKYKINGEELETPEYDNEKPHDKLLKIEYSIKGKGADVGIYNNKDGFWKRVLKFSGLSDIFGHNQYTNGVTIIQGGQTKVIVTPLDINISGTLYIYKYIEVPKFYVPSSLSYPNHTFVNHWGLGF